MHGLDGDANWDGKVDINDLTIVLAHYDQTGQTWAQGEFTGDGTVDINDLTIVLAHYGQTAGASAGGISAVPEPSTLLLTAAGLLGLLPALGGYASSSCDEEDVERGGEPFCRLVCFKRPRLCACTSPAIEGHL